MEGRKDQLVDEEIMQTAAVAPPEPDENWEESQQEQGESDAARPSQSAPEPSIPPPPG
ncbi:hypothetical protein IC614_11360 [Allosphingosinicella flava]|uniref:Uncharacterized protein n=1 Tax=Allosphingosinicella flava TaxID=2771430 RepID=A0A7T2GJ91_9SPHN|nr:hypothetical protein [Sphingosinicella flava]QPQ54898.1 hypothetical protein IC614_11360 [Sphingosinicella flava]